MIASKHAHPIAEFLAAFTPPLTASAPPVKKPAMTTTPISSACHLIRHRRPLILGERTCIIRIFLLPYSLDRAVKCREQTTPYAKVTAEDRGTGFNCG